MSSKFKRQEFSYYLNPRKHPKSHKQSKDQSRVQTFLRIYLSSNCIQSDKGNLSHPTTVPHMRDNSEGTEQG